MHSQSGSMSGSMQDQNSPFNTLPRGKDGYLHVQVESFDVKVINN